MLLLNRRLQSLPCGCLDFGGVTLGMWLAPCVGGSSQTQKMLSACPMKALTDRSEAHAPQNLTVTLVWW